MTEYEHGFIDGVKSKVTAELTPVITKMAGGLNQTIQEAVKTVIGNVKITAHEPSADVQPIKHGEWIKVSWNNYKCSLCDTQYVGMGAITFTYCPNCGAKMIKDGDTD